MSSSERADLSTTLYASSLHTEPANERANVVLSFWFGEGWSELGQTGLPADKMKMWFSGDAATDQVIRLNLKPI